MILYEFTASSSISYDVVVEMIEFEQMTSEHPYKPGWTVKIEKIDEKNKKIHYFVEGEFE